MGALEEFYPDFYEMLTHTAVLERNTGPDQWGNETYAAPEQIKCFILDQGLSFGTDDGQDKQDQKQVGDIEILTDGVGINLTDKITFDTTTIVVTRVSTPKDENGYDVIHTVTGTTAKRG